MTEKNPFVARTYHELWLDHMSRMLNAGYSINQAKESHRLWKSLGKKAKAGRL